MGIKELEITVVTLALGQTVFISTKDIKGIFPEKTLNPSDWSVSQLRAMADYMEENRDMTIYSDGSGKEVVL